MRAICHLALVVVLMAAGCAERAPEDLAGSRTLPIEDSPASPSSEMQDASASEADRWEGRDFVEWFVPGVHFGSAHIMPDGAAGTTGLAYVTLPPPMVVFGGAGEVEVTLENVRHDIAGPPFEAAHPSPPTFTLRYLTAAGDWQSHGTMVADETVVLKLAPEDADMPHATTSLWAFEIESSRGEFISADLRIVVHRAADGAAWPGYGDPYAEGPERIILDEPASVSHPGAAALLEPPPSVRPTGLVAYGTARLFVEVEVTSLTSRTLVPESFVLDSHDATKHGRTFEDWTRHQPVEVDDGTYRFVVDVAPEGIDGPYQSSSRWSFRVEPTRDNGLCPKCFDYEMEYVIRIVANTS